MGYYTKRHDVINSCQDEARPLGWDSSWVMANMRENVGSVDHVVERDVVTEVLLQITAIIMLLIPHMTAHLFLIEALYDYFDPDNRRRVSVDTLSAGDLRHGQGEGNGVRRVASEPSHGDEDGDHSSTCALTCPYKV